MTQTEAPQQNKRRWRWLALATAIIIAAIVAYTKITIFVIQPIGAIPDGVTDILWRQSEALNFVDSADGVCQRIDNGVSLMCRMAALAGVAENNTILLTLPYSRTLYLMSTGGNDYEQ